MSVAYIASIVHALVSVIAVVIWSALLKSDDVPLYIPITAILILFTSSGIGISSSKWSTFIDGLLTIALIVLAASVYAVTTLSTNDARQFVIASSITAALVSP